MAMALVRLMVGLLLRVGLVLVAVALGWHLVVSPALAGAGLRPVPPTPWAALHLLQHALQGLPTAP